MIEFATTTFTSLEIPRIAEPYDDISFLLPSMVQLTTSASLPAKKL